MVALGFEPSYHGRDGYLEHQRRWFEHWGDFRVVPELAIDKGNDLVVLGRMGGHDLRSRVPIDTEFGTFDTFEGGRLVRQRVFLSHREALAAADLSHLTS